MPHIPFEPGVPGIRGPMVFRPETAKPLRQLAEILLRSTNTLTPGERELIATYVSRSMIVTIARLFMDIPRLRISMAMTPW